MLSPTIAAVLSPKERVKPHHSHVYNGKPTFTFPSLMGEQSPPFIAGCCFIAAVVDVLEASKGNINNILRSNQRVTVLQHDLFEKERGKRSVHLLFKLNYCSSIVSSTTLLVTKRNNILSFYRLIYPDWMCTMQAMYEDVVC